MIAVRVTGGKGHRLYLAAGASANYFFGGSVDDFASAAPKIRPTLEYEFGSDKWLKRIQLAYTWRYYKGISVTPVLDRTRSFGTGNEPEPVHGASVALFFESTTTSRLHVAVFKVRARRCFAAAQSRLTVASDTPTTLAISGISRPAKTFNSAICA